MRFGQNVLRMTWKERLVQFSWKAPCFLVSERISGPRDEFENFDAPKCDLAKTSCAWPEKSVLYHFHEKRTVFPLWREFEASFTNLRNLALKNQIWPKRAAHDLKNGFCTIFIESALFSGFEENLRLVWRLGKLWRSKIRFGQKVLRMTWKKPFGQFSWKTRCFPDLKRISGQCDDFKNFDAQKCAQFFCFEEMRMTWKAHSLSNLTRIWGQFHEFEKFAAQKCDLAKTWCAWPEKSVLYNFLGKRTVFLFWRNAHDLKRASCKIFMEGALFSRFRENFRPAWRFWELWRSKMRFGQNVLRMTWNAGFVQFSCKAHCFSALKKIWGQFHDFQNFDLAKKCSAWPEKSVLYNFHEKAHCFPDFKRISGQCDDFKNFDA